MKKETKSTIDRRTFIKSTAAGAGVIAATGGGLIGVGQGEPLAGEASAKPSFKTPPAPIPAWEIREVISADVVVVGAGISGVTAALSAAKAGASVLVLEKHTTFTARGSDNTALNTRLQKSLGITIDKELVIRELMRWSGNKADQRLIRLWADNCDRVMDMFLDMLDAAGIVTTIAQWPAPEGTYDFAAEYYGQFPSCHRPTGGQTVLVRTVAQNAVKSGVDFRYETRAVQLLKGAKGRVTGVLAATKEGDYVQFMANKAVVLCTGDYGNNPEMMQKYCSWAADIAKANNRYTPPLNTGDGHMMAMWAGAVMELAPHAPMDHAGGWPGGVNAYLRVNKYGDRFENEDVPNQSSGNSNLRQPGWGSWQILDADWGKYAPYMGVGLGKTTVVTEATQAALEAKVKAGTAFKADTIADLAPQIKVPVDTLVATVQRYNELAHLGVDLDFGKRPDRLTPTEKPPFYSGWGGPSFLVVVGGLTVNTKLQPLDANGVVIPGLYLGGYTVGNMYANDYPTMCPGHSHSRAWTTGCIAGENAAKEA
jgi:fumarate reductase flavoprotein subunit